MNTVILADGAGMRISQETAVKPKPMVDAPEHRISQKHLSPGGQAPWRVWK
jgi:NDP-sugar pyrophosphorylase family protein